jgi:hypothetical protein
MSSRGVRIVVGEGPSSRKGLLRFVLDGEGFDVVAEAATTAELARLMATHRPDVVVLDDGIGATAVGMINEMSPNTKVVLVWPGAVVPIGGAARVEPARVLQDLGATVERLTGQPAATASERGAALLESAVNDPDMLDAMLLGSASLDDLIIEDREPAPVVILPLSPTIDHGELILNVPDADDDALGVAAASAGGATAAAAGAEVIPLAAGGPRTSAQSALNRRLGNSALAGAAVASALVLALALSGPVLGPISGDFIGAAPSDPPTSVQTPGQEQDPGSPNEGGEGDPGTQVIDTGGDISSLSSGGSTTTDASPSGNDNGPDQADLGGGSDNTPPAPTAAAHNGDDAGGGAAPGSDKSGGGGQPSGGGDTDDPGGEDPGTPPDDSGDPAEPPADGGSGDPHQSGGDSGGDSGGGGDHDGGDAGGGSGH